MYHKTYGHQTDEYMKSMEHEFKLKSNIFPNFWINIGTMKYKQKAKNKNEKIKEKEKRKI